MPIYEYRCKTCGDEFEELVLGRDKEPSECPKCQSHEIEKKISSTSFTLTGKGWYATDYGGRNPGAVPASDSDSSEGGSSGDSSTSSDKGVKSENKGSSPQTKVTPPKKGTTSESPSA